MSRALWTVTGVEVQREPWPGGAPCPLITAFRDRARDLSCAQQPTTARVAVALISDDAIWPGARTPASARSQDANPRQDGL